MKRRWWRRLRELRRLAFAGLIAFMLLVAVAVLLPRFVARTPESDVRSRRPFVADWIPEPTRRELYRLWMSLNDEAGKVLPDPGDHTAVLRGIFAERLAAEPVGGYDKLQGIEVDAIVGEGDREKW